MPAGHQSVRAGDEADGSSGVASGEAGRANPFTVLLNELYPDFYTGWFSAVSDGSAASTPDKEADGDSTAGVSSLLKGSNASGGGSNGSGVLTSASSGLTSVSGNGSTSTPASPTSGGTNQSSGVTSGSTQDSKTGSEQSSSTPAAGTGSQQPSGQPSSGKGPAGSQSQSSSSTTQPQDSPASQSQSKESPASQSQSKESPASQSQSKESPASQSQSQTGKSQSSSSTSPSSTSGPSGKRDTSGQPAGTQGGGGGPPKGGSQGTGQAKPSTSKTGVDLNITSQEATNEFEYKKDGEYVTYSAKGNNAFKAVMDGTTEVWKTLDSSEYSLKVELDLMNNNARAVTIYFDDNKTKVLKNDAENDLWITIDTTKVNPCSLNINYSSETYLYKNEHKNNVRTFTTRSGFAFKCANEYIDGNKVEIWKTNNETEYGNKIEIDLMNDDAKVVTVYFVDKKTMVLKKDGKNEPWNEIDTSKVNPKSIDITDTKETYFYSNKLDKNVRTFTAKKGFAFNDAIEFIDDNKVEIWKADKENEYSNKIEVDLMNKDSKAVSIYVPRNKTTVLKKDGKNQPWNEIDLSKLNHMLVNINHQFDTYFYIYKLDKNIRRFTAKKGFAFNHVNDYANDNKFEIWKTNTETEYGNKIDIELMDNDLKLLTIYFGDDTTKLFSNDGKNEPWNEIDNNKINPRSVNITDTKESYFYSNKLYKNVRTFKAKKGFAFKGAIEFIDDNKVEIWKTDQESEYSHMIEVDHMNNDGKAVTLYLNDDRTKVFKKDGKNDSWNEIDVSKVNPKPINIDEDKQTYFYSNNLYKFFRLFMSKKGFAFNVVKDSNTDIWATTDESEYANKIILDHINNDLMLLTIYFTDDKNKLFTKEVKNDSWNEIDLSIVNPRSVNIKDNKDSYFYTNKLDKSVRTFVAKTGFAFNDVNDYIDGQKVEIWKTDQETEYGNKIRIDVMDNDLKLLTIYFADDTTKLFSKDGKYQPWNEIDTNKVNPRSVNITDTKESYFYSNKLDENVRTFESKKGFSFNIVNEIIDCNKVEIWKTDQESEYSNMIEVDLMNNDGKAVTLYMNDDRTKVFTKSGKNQPFTEIDTNKVNPKSMDITDDKQTYFYSNMLQGFTRTFESKKGFAFNVVKDSNTDIWATTDESEYANKIILDHINNDIKSVTIYLPEKKMKVFKKEGMNQPWDEIDTSKLNPESVDINYEHETNSYKNEFQGSTRTFEAQDGFSFNCIHEYVDGNKVEIWTTSNESEYVNKIEVDLINDSKAVVLYIDDDRTKVFKKDGKNEVWKEIDLSKVNPESVDINYEHKTHSFENELKGTFRTFTAKTGFVFNCAHEYINDNKVEIWKSDNESQYVNKIEVDSLDNDGKAVTIHLDGDKSKLFKKDSKNEPWTEIDVSKINAKSIDISSDKETYFHTYRFDNNVRTFEPKNGFAFNFVKCGNTDICTTSDETEYARKVEYAERYSGIFDLTIDLVNGNKKLFIKEEANDPWKEIDITIVHPKSVNIDYEHETHSYKNELHGKTRTFTAKNKFPFNVVNEGSGSNKVEIWKAEDESKYANKIEVDFLDNDGKSVTIHFPENKTKVFKKDGKNEVWKEIDLSKVNPESVDINYEHKTHSFENELKGTFRTFTAKTGFVFNCAHEYINDNKVEIWTTSNECEYSNKIEVDSLDNDGKALTIHMDGDKTKLFMKESKSDPWTEIDLSKVNLMLVNINYEHDTYFYSNKLDKNVRTFTAKQGFTFKGAHEYINDNKVEIWKSDQESECANKIEVERNNKVTIYIERVLVLIRGD
ncbi:hypothetical protein MACJ_002545 [Theileria orientalis]|uniref:Uncharacterized protein n=1 Tax=Theileria orientalis TaxID=68886 RepID=A0A976QSS2_THEOR|nr:hypothetical protein MACJ_002545 [Theileria orientalis]